MLYYMFWFIFYKIVKLDIKLMLDIFKNQFYCLAKNNLEPTLPWEKKAIPFFTTIWTLFFKMIFPMNSTKFILILLVWWANVLVLNFIFIIYQSLVLINKQKKSPKKQEKFVGWPDFDDKKKKKRQY